MALWQGYNSALTAHAEAPRRRGPDQIKEMKLKLHSAIASVLRRLASDPHTTIIIMSGSERAVLDEVGEPSCAFCLSVLCPVLFLCTWLRHT